MIRAEKPSDRQVDIAITSDDGDPVELDRQSLAQVRRAVLDDLPDGAVQKVRRVVGRVGRRGTAPLRLEYVDLESGNVVHLGPTYHVADGSRASTRQPSGASTAGANVAAAVA